MVDPSGGGCQDLSLCVVGLSFVLRPMFVLFFPAFLTNGGFVGPTSLQSGFLDLAVPWVTCSENVHDTRPASGCPLPLPGPKDTISVGD